MARIDPDPVNPQQKPEVSEMLSASDISKAAALQLCVNDAASSEAWISSNYWGLRWRESDALYQSPPYISLWEGTTQPKANITRFVVAETVNSIHPQIMNGLFYEEPAFVLRSRPNQKQNTIRAITELLSIQFDEMGFRQETGWMLQSAILFGTGIGKWGYKNYTREETRYVRSSEPVTVPAAIPGQPPSQIPTPQSMDYEKVVDEKEVHCPFFENRDIRYVLVEPGCRVSDIRRAKFVIDRMYMTYRDLVKLANEEYTETVGKKKVTKKRYDLPSESEIKSWFETPVEQVQHPDNSSALTQGTTQVHHAMAPFEKTTADPLDEPLEVLERWDNDKVITVIQRKKCIRNEPNEFGIIPFLSVNWWDIPDAFWGLGLGRVIGVEQRVQQGIINACLDLASLIVNPMFVTARGSNVQTQQIRQRIGGILQVDVGGEGKPKNTKEAISLIEQPHIPAEVIQQIALSEGRVEKTSGANQQLTMGASSSSGAKGQIGRSGTGASALIQATMNRIGGFAETFVRQVYEPLIYQMHELNRDKTPIPYIQEVLGDSLGPDFKFDADDFKNAKTEFEVLAGSHLAAKAHMEQSLFIMLQLFQSEPVLEQLKLQNKKVNIEELLHMVHDASGWKNYYDVIQPMTPEEIQAMQQQQNPMMQKVQGQMAVNDQKFGHDQALIDQENEARVSRDMLRQIVKDHTSSELGGNAPPGA